MPRLRASAPAAGTTFAPRALASALTLAISVLAPGRSAAAPADSVEYALITPPSALEVGCQGPCECAVGFQPTYGSFVLVETGVDPLYTYYRVDRYIASFNNGPGAVSIVGTGHYRIGGEFAAMQQMTLDLQVWGQPHHFDSGLVPVRAPFPEIDISCAVHGFACYDSVLVVEAKEDKVTGVPPANVPAGLQAARPNPFRSQTTLVFALDRVTRADLTILDVAGRRVRTLASGKLVGPGGQTETWDGRRDDGRLAPSGVYWAVLRREGGADRTLVVKVR